MIPKFCKPDFDRPLIAQSVILKNAVVVPPPKGDVNRTVVRAGVLDSENNFVPESITWSGDNQLNTAPNTPLSPPELHKGRYLFMGPMFGHFGHFMVESIARFWALEAFKNDYDGIVFYPKFHNSVAKILATQLPLVRALGAGAHVLSVEDATRFETLIVPPQGIGMFDMITGTPESRKFARIKMGKIIPPDGPDKIYISRSRLGAEYGSILGENILELLLEEAGYTVFHPQMHTPEEQVAAYRAARFVISMDTSPLHLLAMVGSPDVKVAVLPRRSGELPDMFVAQLQSFLGCKAQVIGCLIANWNTPRANRIDRHAWSEISFLKACDGLRENGFLDPSIEWPDFDDGLIAELSTEMGLTQKFVDGVSQTPKPHQRRMPARSSPKTVLAAVREAKNTSEIARAIELAQDGLCEFPDDPQILSNLEALFRSEQRYEDALQILDQLEKINGAKPNIHFLRSKSWAGLKNHDRALADIDHAIKAAPNALQYVLHRARIFEDMGCPELALSTLMNVFEAAQSDPMFLRYLSRVQVALNDTVGAQTSIQSAIKLSPDVKEFQKWSAHLDRKSAKR